MPSQGLSPSFTSPLASIPAASIAEAVSIFFALTFVVWLIYTLVAAYHLLRYGHKSAVSIPALITHVLVSAALASFAVSGLY